MLRGCLFALGLYAALAVGYFLWFDRVFEPPETYLGAGVVGFLILCCLGALNNARTARRDWSLISAARHALPPRDGELIGVAGTIQPVGQPLLAPFSGAECVLCEYDLAGPQRVADAPDRETTGSDYAGFLMTPSVIRSAAGDIRLLGFPILEGFDDLPCFGAAAARNARDFLARTSFDDRAGLKLVSVFSVFGDVWSDDDGLVEKNLKLSAADPQTMFPLDFDEALAQQERWEAAPPDERTEGADAGDRWDGSESEDSADIADDDGSGPLAAWPKLTEKRVAVGEPVCAVGIYNEMRRGLLPPGRGRTPNRLLRGSVEQIEDKSRRAFLRNLIGSLVALVIIHTAIYGVMQAYLRAAPG